MELFLPHKELKEQIKNMSATKDRDEKIFVSENSRKRSYPKEEAMSLDIKLRAANNQIIETRVKSDAVIGELKQKIKDLEKVGDHRLERIYVQQKHIEELKEDFEKEKRLREEINNRVNTNRDINIVLQNHCLQVKDLVVKFHEDRSMLSDSYSKACNTINTMRTENFAKEQRSKIEVEKLQDQLKCERHLGTENEKNWTNSKQHYEEVIQHLKEGRDGKINALQGEKETLLNQISIFTKEVDTYKTIQNQSEQELQSLQENFKNNNEKNLLEISNMSSLIKQHENQIEHLKCSLNNCNSEKEQQDKIIATLKCEGNNKDIAFNEERTKLNVEKEIAENELKAVKAAKDASHMNENILNSKISTQKMKITELEENISIVKEENAKKDSKIDELTELIAANEISWKTDKTNLLNELKKLTETQQEEMQLNKKKHATILSLEKELHDLKHTHQIENQNKTVCINSLETELKNKSFAFESLENQIKCLKDQCEYYCKSLEQCKVDKANLGAELQVYLENLREKTEYIKQTNENVHRLEEMLNSKCLKLEEMEAKNNEYAKKCSTNIAQANKIENCKLMPTKKDTKSLNLKEPNDPLKNSSKPLPDDCGMLSDSSYNSIVYNSSYLDTLLEKIEATKTPQIKPTSEFVYPTNREIQKPPENKKRTRKTKVVESKHPTRPKKFFKNKNPL